MLLTIVKFGFKLFRDFHDFLEFTTVKPDSLAFWAHVNHHSRFVDFHQLSVVNRAGFHTTPFNLEINLGVLECFWCILGFEDAGNHTDGKHRNHHTK
jgi:hypothetical protein